MFILPPIIISDYKDTNFWKQFTTQTPNRPNHTGDCSR